MDPLRTPMSSSGAPARRRHASGDALLLGATPSRDLDALTGDLRVACGHLDEPTAGHTTSPASATPPGQTGGAPPSAGPATGAPRGARAIRDPAAASSTAP